MWFGSSSQHKSLLQGFCSTSNYVSQRILGQFIESILQTSLIGIWLEFGIPNVPAVFWFCLSYNFVNLFNADIQRPFVLLNFILSVKWIEFNTVISYIVCACNSDILTMFSKPCDNNKHVWNDVQYFSKPGNTFFSCVAEATWRFSVPCFLWFCLVWPKIKDYHTSLCLPAPLLVIGLYNVLEEYGICAKCGMDIDIYLKTVVCCKLQEI